VRLICGGGLLINTSLQIIDVAIRTKSRVASLLFVGVLGDGNCTGKVGDVEPETKEPLEILKCRFCAYDLWPGDMALGLIPPGLGVGDSDPSLADNAREGPSTDARRVPLNDGDGGDGKWSTDPLLDLESDGRRGVDGV
jgi:hypothetical protein